MILTGYTFSSYMFRKETSNDVLLIVFSSIDRMLVLINNNNEFTE